MMGEVTATFLMLYNTRPLTFATKWPRRLDFLTLALKARLYKSLTFVIKQYKSIKQSQIYDYDDIVMSCFWIIKMCGLTSGQSVRGHFCFDFFEYEFLQKITKYANKLHSNCKIWFRDR